MTSRPTSDGVFERRRAGTRHRVQRRPAAAGQLYANHVTDTDIVIARKSDETQLMIYCSGATTTQASGSATESRRGEPTAHRSLMTEAAKVPPTARLMIDDPPPLPGQHRRRLDVLGSADSRDRAPAQLHRRRLPAGPGGQPGGRVNNRTLLRRGPPRHGPRSLNRLGRAAEDAVRNDAPPRDPLPAEPYIDHVTDPGNDHYQAMTRRVPSRRPVLVQELSGVPVRTPLRRARRQRLPADLAERSDRSRRTRPDDGRPAPAPDSADSHPDHLGGLGEQRPSRESARPG